MKSFGLFFIYLCLAFGLWQVAHHDWAHRDSLIVIAVFLILFTALLWPLLGNIDPVGVSTAVIEPMLSKAKSIQVGDCLKPRQLTYDRQGKIIYEDQV